MIDPSSQQYRNGRAFGEAYAARHGMDALARCIRNDVFTNARRAMLPTCEYIAGEIDAALWAVSAREAKP